MFPAQSSTVYLEPGMGRGRTIWGGTAHQEMGTACCWQSWSWKHWDAGARLPIRVHWDPQPHILAMDNTVPGPEGKTSPLSYF